MLFSGTIASNLKLGNEKLTEEEMKRVAQISQSLEFIDKKKMDLIVQFRRVELMYLVDKNNVLL